MPSVFAKQSKTPAFISMFNTTLLPYNKPYNNCSNTLCYTHNKNNNFIYKPHSDTGLIGTTSAAYLSKRKRI